jgi:antitoxin FitA
MPTIQIRNVPEALHRQLKALAAAAGMSLSTYLIAEMTGCSGSLTLGEMRDRLHKRQPVTVDINSARLVKEERDGR